MSYVFQSTLIDTMQQYAALAAEEYLSAAGANGDAIQRDLLQGETDAELANDAVRASSLDEWSRRWTATRWRRLSPICANA